jgi:hypothetical protein
VFETRFVRYCSVSFPLENCDNLNRISGRKIDDKVLGRGCLDLFNRNAFACSGLCGIGYVVLRILRCRDFWKCTDYAISRIKMGNCFENTMIHGLFH